MVFSHQDFAKYLAEFLGTFVLVLTAGCNVLAKNTDWGATSICCSLMVMTYALYSVSGAHLNPAVTLAVAVSGKMSESSIEVGWHVVLYMLSQIFGGMGAALVYWAIFRDSFNIAPRGISLLRNSMVVSIIRNTCVLILP